LGDEEVMNREVAWVMKARKYRFGIIRRGVLREWLLLGEAAVGILPHAGLVSRQKRTS
jgi:hypothetical protein